MRAADKKSKADSQERLISMVNSFRKTINPPYSAKDFVMIFVTIFILISIPLTAILAQQGLRTRALAAPIIVEPGTSINAAINAAPSGSTILVKSGTYNEQVEIAKSITLQAYGDGAVWVDGECARDNNFLVLSSTVTLRNLGAKRANAEAVKIGQGSDVTVDGMTIQDYNCAENLGQYFAGVAAWYSGPHITVTNNVITRRVDLTGDLRGFGNGIWFKSRSTDPPPSGGGHYIADNIITGGYDGIGGEEEDDPHGSFDKDTTIERNTISDCWDDGIQVEGGDVNIYVRDNHIERCAIGIAFAPNLVGPLYIERNTISNLIPGYYGASYAFKIGDVSQGITYLTDNQAYTSGDGIKQSNAGVGPIVARGNIIQVTRYVIEFSSPVPPGTDYDLDCLWTTDPTRFIKWGGAQYLTLSSFQQATGQELTGQQTTDCSLPGDTTPPVRSNGSPPSSPPLAAGTVSTPISLTTNENATCKYATTAGVSYSSMPNTFSTTGGTSHSSLITGLTNDTSYNYYVRCRDTSPNQNTNSDDFTISFSVASSQSQPSVNLLANNSHGPITIIYNDWATLTWVATNTDGDQPCSASDGWSGSRTAAGSESTGRLTANKTFTITCNGLGGRTASDSVTVNVGKIGDLNGNGVVDFHDFSTLVSRWGTNDPIADLNLNGFVDFHDFSTLVSHWGS